MKNIIKSTAFLAALMLPAAASAATATGKMNVRIAIQASCEVVSTSDLDFGTVATTSAAIDQSAAITVKCSNSTPFNIGLGGGTSGSVNDRKMSGPGNGFVSYSLYRDSSRTQHWGDTPGTNTSASTGTGANQTFTVYGRVNSQNTPEPGSYSDVVTVTINY